MPGVSLHFVLADRALQRWRAHHPAPPFDLDDPAALNAYFNGAVGPDLGYFPGGVRALSDLAHCLRSGGLARNLVRQARTVRERAFAWGWVTHVLADQAIHPWIGRGVGELLHGDRERFVDGSSDLQAHLRVEMGIDAWFAQRYPEVRRRRLAPAFDARGIGFLVRAYSATYGVPFEGEPFLRSHRAAARRTSQALATVGLVHALLDDGADLPGIPGLRWALRAAYHTGALRNVTVAYLTPVHPSPWLQEAVDREADTLPVRVLDAYDSDGRCLEDRNLDTGRLLESQPEHPGTRRALDAVAARSPATCPVPVPTAGVRQAPGLVAAGQPAEA